MNPIDLKIVNVYSPYAVWFDDDVYYFKTDFDILYAVSFDEEGIFVEDAAYWFNLSNMTHKKSPGDKKIGITIKSLINGFFDANPNILLYMCDTANGQQAERNRLFKRWFKSFNNAGLFKIKSAVVKDEGVDNYVSIIVQQSNPKLESIMQSFSEQIELFNANK